MYHRLNGFGGVEVEVLVDGVKQWRTAAIETDERNPCRLGQYMPIVLAGETMLDWLISDPTIESKGYRRCET